MRLVEHGIHNPHTTVRCLALDLKNDTVVHCTTVSLFQGRLENRLHLDIVAPNPQIWVAPAITREPRSLDPMPFFPENSGTCQFPNPTPEQLRVHRAARTPSLTPMPVATSPDIAQSLAHHIRSVSVDLHGGGVCVGGVRTCDGEQKTGTGAQEYSQSAHLVRLLKSR